MKKSKGIKKEIDILRKELLKDKNYYYAWQANIAMAFQDEFNANHKYIGVHEISNNAAKKFLDMLIGKMK